MKLLTLNTHSLQEENYFRKLQEFAAYVSKEAPDIIAMQEVNQSQSDPLADEELLSGYVACDANSVPVRMDNHAAQVAKYLRNAGLNVSWTWISGKVGYGKYDEGMALMSLNGAITEVESFYISQIQDYQNWKTRKVLGIKTEHCEDWFYTVHMGWWDDEEEPFANQWNVFQSYLEEKRNSGCVWLMGDFNSPAQVAGQGYDQILASGWKDTYLMAEEKDDGITVPGVIDGWRDKLKDDSSEIHGMRIDHIWCSQKKDIQTSYVVFNGKQEPVVSDHFGVMVIY
ncbi:MAG: endonuclease/exonuclease/phosphatase family protein [Ruminococcus sp.]|nr:endonuclease/exonuclease/phosphatase family protein [Ruminococcus sp.]